MTAKIDLKDMVILDRDTYDNMVESYNQLKGAFSLEESYSEQVEIRVDLPSIWGVVNSIFLASEWNATHKLNKDLIRSYGVSTEIAEKIRPVLSEEGEGLDA